MRFFPLGLAFALLAATLLALLLFGQSGSILGLDPRDFARLGSLIVLALLIGSGLVLGRFRVKTRLWHAAVWLAILVALMAGYQFFHPGGPIFNPAAESRSA